MKLFNMYLSFYIQKHKKNKLGYSVIYARVTIDKIRYNFSTGLKIKAKNWISGKYRHKNNKNLNKEIESFEIHIKQIASALRIDRRLTIENIKELLKPKKADTITLTHLLDDYRLTKIKNNTHAYSDRFYKNILIYFELYKIKTVEQLTNDFKISFFNWLKDTRGIENGKYLQKHFSYLNQTLENACNHEKIKYNPFRKLIKMNFPKKNKQTILTEEELKLFENFKPKFERHKKVKDLYLFSAYTGLSFADVQNFDISQVQKINGVYVILGERKKTNSNFTAPFFDNARKIIEKHNYTMPKLSNQKFNKYLKEIALLIGIDKNLTTHSARRTFGQIMLNRGANIESVSHMLGHKDIRITQQCYASAGTSLVVNQLALLK